MAPVKTRGEGESMMKVLVRANQRGGGELPEKLREVTEAACIEVQDVDYGVGGVK
jgi:hypothetical protein